MSDHYRKNAFECVRLAQKADSGQIKMILMMMARGWMDMSRLAEERPSAVEVVGPSASTAEIGAAVGF